ncbi:FIG00638906: hypothetical protein [Escherichia coli IS35]|nr:FIG00638906: hypothetical protein [Escherichia coli IS35]
MRSEDDAADDADRTEQVQEKAPVEEISLPLLTKMSSERTLAVQAALMQQPDKSLALLAWTLCLMNPLMIFTKIIRGFISALPECVWQRSVQ